MKKILVLMVASLSLAAFAQQQKKPEQRVQEIIFENDVIKGDLQKPDVEYFDAASHANHPSIIKVREDFKEKVLHSAGEL